MAESDKEDRTEEATGRRLQQAHDRGQIPRSRELNTAAMLVAASFVLWSFGGHFAQGMARMMEESFRVSREEAFYPDAMVRHFADAVWEMVKLFGPLLALTVVVALASPIGLGGWNFSTEAIEPKFSKINPWNGLKRLFGMQGLIELVKSVFKVLLIGIVSWRLLRHYWDKMLGLGDLPLMSALATSTDMLGFSLLVLSLSLVLIAAVDVPVQLWTYKRDLRMTKQEVKDESKETEGSPQVKQKIRQMQMEFAVRRMMEAVPKADVVVTNPTHYAVALQYQQGGVAAAPRVVAKGADLVAA
ncbi:flagellar type III secretion system protein FlhB, partial [Methylogaea oryzae]